MITSITVGGSSITLSTYGAKCVGKSLTQGTFTPKQIKAGKALTARYIKTETSPYALQLDFFITGATHQAVFENMLAFENLLKNCQVVLSAEPNFTHYCTLTGAAHQFMNPLKALLTLTFEDDIFGAEVSTTIETNPQTVTITGAKETPITIEVTAGGTDLADFTLTNGTNVMTISALTAGAKMIINGADQTVTVGGVNAFDDTVIYEFPTAQTSFALACDVTLATVKVLFKPRW